MNMKAKILVKGAMIGIATAVVTTIGMATYKFIKEEEEREIAEAEMAEAEIVETEIAEQEAE